ncbi:hypothetical protein BGX29_003381 [Mortierella sp. GBA35]|nr:hypothetical protein BGX29_003381 [Mortierella sp. GBA35]
MKVTLALSAFVALAASTVSAAPANANATAAGLSRRAPCRNITLTWRIQSQAPHYIHDPVYDLQSFELEVDSRYHDWMKALVTRGTKKNNYSNSRLSSDGQWSVHHVDVSVGTMMELEVKGKIYRWDRANSWLTDRYQNKEKMEYWACINWDE